MDLQHRDLSNLREEYRNEPLNIDDVSGNPFIQFDRWIQTAIDSKVMEVNAMTLSTVNKKGKPSGRVVLLKGFDRSGFVFYTNYNSSKGQDIEANPNVSLVFCWLELARQIRIEGRASKVHEHDSDEYFHSRPRGSQLAAWASSQSEIVEDRTQLEKKMSEYENKFGKSGIIPRPPYWGGYRVIPESIEFWQGRENRFHDRIRYDRSGKEKWKISRLAP